MSMDRKIVIWTIAREIQVRKISVLHFKIESIYNVNSGLSLDLVLRLRCYFRSSLGYFL